MIKKKTIIHVNQHVIRRNNKTGEREPVLSCKKGKKNEYGYEVIIYDKEGNEVGKVVYRCSTKIPMKRDKIQIIFR